MNKSYRDLFKGTAPYYARYRHQFPAEFFNLVAGKFKLDSTGRMLDLGCGTGQLAIPFAAYFEEVIGLDPEPEMLEQAALAAETAGATNIRWLEGGSADLPDLQPQLGKFRLVAMGNSFHWMDQAATLANLDEMVEPGGGLVITGIGAGSSFGGTFNGWQNIVNELLKKWLGETRRAGSGTYQQPTERFEQILARSSFSRVERLEMNDTRFVSIEEIIGLLYSTSYASKAVLGDKQAGFEQELRETLLRTNPGGKFAEQMNIEIILAQRPA